MSRRSNPSKNSDSTPLDKKQHALKAELEQIQAQLQQARQFLKKAPEMKAEAKRQEQQEILNKFRRPARIEGPTDFRLELVNAKGGPSTRARMLRHERNLGPMLLTVALLAGCVIVFYYVMQILSKG